MNPVVRDTDSMIGEMSPELQMGYFVFCSTADPAISNRCREKAIGSFVEAEGHSFILLARDAEALGFEAAMRMRQITLRVPSALDGVGLTAAVAGELARLGIPCNMVAAYHHDHVFVPEAMADRAFAALVALQNRKDAPI